MRSGSLPSMSAPPLVPMSIVLASWTNSVLSAQEASSVMVAPFFILMKPNALSSTVNFLGSHGPHMFAAFSVSASSRYLVPTTICGS